MAKFKSKILEHPKRSNVVVKPKYNGKQKDGVPKKNKNLKKTPKDDQYGTMSVDDFMNKDFEGSDSESEELSGDDILNDSDASESEELSGDDILNDSDASSTVMKDGDEPLSEDDGENNLEEESSEMEETSDLDQEMGDEEDSDEAEGHKKSLDKLKEIDPEFYKYLQENDKKLLQFNLSDEEGDDSEKDDDAEEEDEVHKPSGQLEVASDESDFEDDDDEKLKDSRIVTLKMLKSWQSQIQTDKSNKTIVALTQAFHAALLRVSSPEDEEVIETVHYKVEGSSVFNAVIQLCVLELGPAIRRFLGLKQGSKISPHKCKKFVKIKRVLKSYFTDLLKILTGVTSPNIQTVLLKHLHYMSSLLISYPNITKSIVKRLITLWGTADESVRVIAFFCILRITHNQQVALLDTVIKSMYMTYVKNAKFVSLSSLAAINFMRRSLVEMFTLDVNIAYQHVFLYIRQLAIHLRNAITVNKKENVQAVYNWQFVNSLKLWGNLLSVTCNKPQLQQLIYPFVQVCLGTLKLVPTPQYYPLRFHVVQILMDLSRDTGIFVPILPFILEVLNNYDFNKKHQKVSMKPLHFTCLLRCSKSQLTENGFKDTVIETIYGQLLEYLSTQSNSIAFSDLSLLPVLQIKQFTKKCKQANYIRKMKQILEKIEQNKQFIEKERNKVSLDLTQFKQIEGWESQIKNKGTPLSTFYESWNKMRNIKKNKQLTNNEELGDYKLPQIKKVNKRTQKESAGPVELFPSDSEDEELEGKGDSKPRRGKRGGKNVRKKYSQDDSGPVEDSGEKDIVQNLEMSDW